jgi:hypothetical protein
MELKSRSSRIVQNMGNYMFQSLEEKEGNFVSPFYKQCEMFYLQIKIGMPTYLPHDEYVKKIRDILENNMKEQEFYKLIKDTQITST